MTKKDYTELQKDNQFSIKRDENNRVFIFDALNDKRYYPDCGESLIQVCAYLRNRPFGDKEKIVQDTLEKAISGKKPITNMIEQFSSPQSFAA